MFNDYITVLLINMSAGFVVLAGFFLAGMDRPSHRHWAAAMAGVGVVALAVGLHMVMTWPIPDLSHVKAGMPNLKFANVAFGEMSVLLGAIFLAMAVATALHWSLMPVALFAVLPGLAAIVLGTRIGQLNLTAAPSMTMAAFILSGLPALLAPAVIHFRTRLAVRIAMALVLLAAAGVWAMTGCAAYWAHMDTFSQAAK